MPTVTRPKARWLKGIASTFAAAKAAVAQMTRYLAGHYGPRGIRVNAVAPGQVQTELLDRVFKALKSEQVATFMTEMLEGVGPAVAVGRDTTMLREILDRTALDELKGLIRHVSELPAETLKTLSRGAWEMARSTHTRPIFAKALRQFLEHDVMPRVSLAAAG